MRRPIEALPRLGRLDPAPGAVEQLRPEPLLERANLEADGRLRDPEPLRRLREALAVDDLAEGGELSRIHQKSGDYVLDEPKYRPQPPFRIASRWIRLAYLRDREAGACVQLDKTLRLAS